MQTSDRTKKLRRLRNGFFWADILCWLGMACFTVVSVICLIDSKDASGIPIFSEDFKALLVSLGATTVIGLIAALVIKDKIRTTIFMLCVILNSIMYKEAGMYVTLAVWFVDEYVLHGLYARYKLKTDINKEIDLR